MAKFTSGFSLTTVSGGPTITWDATALDRAAEYFKVPADLVTTALNNWQSQLLSIGPAWGSGSTASQLNSQYVPVAADFKELLTGLKESFESLGISVAHTSNAVSDTEDANRT